MARSRRVTGRATVDVGVPGGDQLDSFQNATLQYAGDVAVSVACHVDVPEDVVERGAGAVGWWVGQLLSGVDGRLSFHVQVGPNE